MSKKKRLISGILLFAMIFSIFSGLFPTVEPEVVEAAEPKQASIAKIFVGKTQNEIEAIAGAATKEVFENSGWYEEFWHYSGGYWKFNGKTVTDREFGKNLTPGGVGDVGAVYVIDDKPYTFKVPAGSDTANALDDGSELYINIVSNSKSNIRVQELINTTDMALDEDGAATNLVVNGVKRNNDGSYDITILLDLRLNMYSDEELSYKNTYDLNLNKYIPFVKNGYGYNMYAMWRNGVDLGATQGWVDYDNPYSLAGMPEGAIHPTMIRPYNSRDMLGMYTDSRNNGGILYENVPLYDGITGQPLKTADGKFKYTKPQVEITLHKKGPSMFDTTYADIGSGTFNSGGAVGMRFFFPVELEVYTRPPVKIVETYVKLAGIDEEGKFIYEEFAPPTVRPAKIDSKTGYLIFDESDVYRELPGGIAVLNDIITSPKDLTDESDLSAINWLDITPKSPTDSLVLNAQDISYYKFGRITGDEYIVRSVTDIIEQEEVITAPNTQSQIIVEDSEEGAIITLSNPDSNASKDTSVTGKVKTFFVDLFTDKKESEVNIYEIDVISGAQPANPNSSYQPKKDLSFQDREVWEIEQEQLYRRQLEQKYLKESGNTKVTKVTTSPSSTPSQKPSQPVQTIREALSEVETDSSAFVSWWQIQTEFAHDLDSIVDEGQAEIIIKKYFVYKIASEIKKMSEIPIYKSMDKVIKFEIIEETASPEVQNVIVASSNETMIVEKNRNSESTTPEYLGETNVAYVRYFVAEISTQVDVIRYMKDGKPTGLTKVEVNTLPVVINSSGEKITELVNIQEEKPVEYRDAKLDRWYSSEILSVDPNTLPSSNGLFEGTAIEPIKDLPTDQNIYVLWDVNELSPGTISGDVPEWRLSLYKDDIGNGNVQMSLLGVIWGCHSNSLTPSGAYRGNYKTFNPNNLETDTKYNPDNMNLKSIGNPWFHSKVIKSETNSRISKSTPNASVKLTADMNAIKDKTLAGINTASWVQVNSGFKDDLLKHGIETSNTGSNYNGGSTVTKGATLKYRIENKLTYNDKRRDDWGHSDDWGHEHSPLRSRTLTPLYTDLELPVSYNFDRYISQDTKGNILTVSPLKKESNGKTTLAIQENTELKIYPEVPMLFENDKGDESVVFAVGDYARSIKPVTFHSLEYKAFVSPKSIGMSVATDSKAKVTANSKGIGNKQVIYKGSGTTTTYEVSDVKNSNKSGQLVVKSYALDISDSGLKTAWGNGGYNTLNIHNNFLNQWAFKGIASTKLQVAPTLGGMLAYDGALKTHNITTNKVNNLPDITEYTLVVRGGIVTHVNGTAIATVKTSNPSLYEALEGMKLVGPNKDATILKTFERNKGKALTEGVFATKASAVRNNVNDIVAGSGWYMEDSTVLKVVEYTTSYNLPNVVSSDKLPMTVKGLETPVNKNSFFSQMYLGHNYLKFELKSNNIPNLGIVSSYFETSSKEVDTFSDRTIEYGVPNVSVSDTMGLN